MQKSIIDWNLWEVDTIIGEGKKRAIVTLVDRKSHYLRMYLVKQPTKESVRKVSVSLLATLPDHIITCDNDKELADHAGIARTLSAGVYFAYP